MQAELPDTIAIIGVNAVDKEGSNADFTEGRDLPWLQDTEEEAVWATWGVSYRDVVILDADGEFVGVFNLTVNDLGTTRTYEDLKGALLELEP